MRGRQRKAWVLAMALAMMAAPAVAQEGYDPLRQITAQVEKANLLVLQDRTGSMAYAPTTNTSPTAGATGTGNLYWGSDSTRGYTNELSGNSYSVKQWTYPTSNQWLSGPFTVPTNVGPTGVGSTCTNGNCRYWTYVLVFEYPSRMSTVKNVFGATVDIFSSYAAPLLQSAFSGDWAVNTVTVTQWDSSVPLLQQPAFPFWVFTIDYGKNRTNANPGPPFSPMDAAKKPIVDASGACIVGTCQLSKAKNLLETFSDRVNWGLVSFDTSAVEAVTITSTGTPASDIQKLKDYYRAAGDFGPSGVTPLTPGSTTNTILGFTQATTTLQKAINADAKAACGRPYGVILVTDGMSNTGNPGNAANPAGGNWVNPCGTVAPKICDISANLNDCPQQWARYAAAKADSLFRTTTKPGTNPTLKIPVRTWSIGVSLQVGPCELDYIAYMGRTDASSPSGDTGWGGYDPIKNPYLPNVTGANNDSPSNTQGSYPATNSNYDGPTGQYTWFKNRTVGYDPATTGHGHNAYFATNATDLANAIEAIVNASAAGDYATNAPTSGQAIGLGSQVVLPSVQFPGWLGHVYAFDTSVLPTDPKYLLWDAALLINPAARKIYTWDPSNSNNLVLLDTKSATITQLQAIAGAYGLSPSTSLTANVVSFVLGYDVNATPPWSAMRTTIDSTGKVVPAVLGPMINSTPAIEGRPSVFHQTTVQAHTPFESQYSSRHPLVWVGSDDGMMHAFDFATGAEVLAILPPNLLPRQVQLYNNYMSKPQGTRLTGQPDQFSAHLYGVTNSLRFADVWFQSDKSYHTVGIITEGPGGTMIAAVDITHPSPTDPNYDKNNPFGVLWSVSNGVGAGKLPGLFSSWSIPAMGPTKNDTWDVVFGGGQNPASTAAGQVAPVVYSTNISASPNVPIFNSHTLTNRAGSPAVLVGNQAFSDANAFSTIQPAFHSDNLVDLGLQADLNGRIWFQTGGDLAGGVQIGIDASAVSGVSTQQPIYYSPAVSGYGPSKSSCFTVGFGSGSLYEQSTKVTGPNVGTGSNFIPSLYIAVGPKPATGATASPIAATNLYRLPITGTTFNQGDPLHPTATRTLGARTQLTASPFIISPLSGTGPVQLLFLVYDPDFGCLGNSYVISLTFDVPADCSKVSSISPDKMIAYDAGAGAASGFAIAGSTLLVSKSGLGQGARAGLLSTGAQLQTGSSTKVRAVWWKEHK